MKVKTYRAKTFADALASVKKELGIGAVILHTRPVKIGGVLGFCARKGVEVIAADGPAQQKARTSRPRAAASSNPSVLVSPARLRAAYQAAHQSNGRQADEHQTPAAQAARVIAATQPAEVLRVHNTRAQGDSQPRVLDRDTAGASRSSPVTDALQAELVQIKGMVEQVLRNGGMPDRQPGLSGDDPVFGHYSMLLQQQVSSEIANEVVQQVRAEFAGARAIDRDAVRTAVIRGISRHFTIAEDTTSLTSGAAAPAGRQRIIALIGPTGVGKTTTIAKLAADYKIRRGLRVGLVTADTYRIAAIDQLSTYAQIIGLPLEVCDSSESARNAIRRLADCEVILVDTAGRSPRNDDALDELRSLLKAVQPTQTHLVLAGNASEQSMACAADRFGSVGFSSVIVTKLDEAVSFGVLLNVVSRISAKLAFVSAGQEVPDHLERADAFKLARLVLDGPGEYTSTSARAS